MDRPCIKVFPPHVLPPRPHQFIPLRQPPLARDTRDRSMPAPRRPWKPFAARNCCTVDDHVVLRNLSLNLSRCRPTRSDFSKKVAEPPSFRRISISDLSSSSSARFNEEFAHAFGAGLYAFQLGELRAITHDFSSSYLLGEGGFGTVHKGYVDDRMRAGLKAQAVAVKLLDIEGLQGHREWLVRIKFLTS